MPGYPKRKQFHKSLQTDSVIRYGLIDYLFIGKGQHFPLRHQAGYEERPASYPLSKSSSFLGIEEAGADHSRSVRLSVYNNSCFILIVVWCLGTDWDSLLRNQCFVTFPSSQDNAKICPQTSFIGAGFELLNPMNRYAEIMRVLKLRSHQCQQIIYVFLNFYMLCTKFFA
jgi:hypothetical protein